jgi:penicillin-binding protein 1A
VKPIVYLAAFASGATLDSSVPDAPVRVSMGWNRPGKWIANYDGKFKGPIPMRLALAESRNAATVWIARQVGIDPVLQTARALGIESRLQRYVTTALGASEVSLLELANAYRAMASGLAAEPFVIERITDASGTVLFERDTRTRPLPVPPEALERVQEGLRGVVRLPGGTAHSLQASGFPIPVMGKTGTTSDFRDALFVGSSYGQDGVTVAVRVGYDDNRPLGEKETGGRTALPIFEEILQRAYGEMLLGGVPQFPRRIEQRIDEFLARHAAPGPEPLPAAPAS